MNWILIDKYNLPAGKVLAANFDDSCYLYKEKMIGYLSLDGDYVQCDNGFITLWRLTHYIDIDKFDLE